MATVRPLTRLGLLATAYATLFALVYYLTVHTVAGRQVADASLRGALTTRSALAGTVDRILNVVSVASLLGAVAVVALIALLRLQRVQGLVAIGILAGSNLSAWLLKDILLPRPDVGLDEVAPATLNSLPSGHSTAAFSAVAALMFVLPRRWRLPIVWTGAAFATLTAVATMSAGWHRAGDSVAAFLLVGLWTVAACAVVVVMGPAASDENDAGRGADTLRWLSAAAVGGVFLGLVMDLGVVAADPSPGSWAGAWSALLAGVLLVIGAACGCLVGMLVALDVMDRR